MIRSTFCVVGMRMYIASKSGWGSRMFVMDSITSWHNILERCALWVVPDSDVQVTRSARISNCLRTALRSLCEYSSTTKIFHPEGGLTDRKASRNSAERQEFQQVSVSVTKRHPECSLTVARSCDQRRHVGD